MPGKQPQDIDVTLGRNIRDVRLQRGWTRVELAQALGITAHQLHKYEAGTNRVAASRLCRVAMLLDVDLRMLFDGTGVVVGQDAPTFSAESLAVAMAYEHVRSDHLRQAIRQFLVGLCDDRVAGIAEPPQPLALVP